MFDSRIFEEIMRGLEDARRRYSHAQHTIETTKRELAEFILLNAELIAQGEKLDLSAYEESIEEATWDRNFAEKTFQENKDRMAALVSRLTISY